MIFKDQLNREVVLDIIPKRIISLVPSQTELLHGLGLSEQIVGQTLFCVHPKNKFKDAVKIGGTKKLNIEKIQSLKPDLIIANKEENEKAQIEALSSDFPVWISDVNSFEDALKMIQSIGVICSKSDEAKSIISNIESKRNLFKEKRIEPKTVIYLIWNQPFMAAGKKTFIDTMLTEAGYINLIKTERYPKISLDEIKELNPDYVFLSSEPFPFKENHCNNLNIKLKAKKALIVDGEMFSWYGSRLSQSFEYYTQLRDKLIS